MEKPGTINLVGDDRAEGICRMIIKTHKYYLENVSILTDRERGYFYNEYFPAVKRYLKPPAQIVPLFTGNGVREPDTIHNKTPAELEEFRHKKDVQLLGFHLSYIPEAVNSVRIAKNKNYYDMGRSYMMIWTQDYTVNMATGAVDFPKFFIEEDKQKIHDIFYHCGITDEFSVFVKYVPTQPKAPTRYMKQSRPYEVGEDGE